MNFLKFSTAENFYFLNRSLVKDLGIKPTIFLYELISQYQECIKKGTVSSFDYDGVDYFYASMESIKENTTLGRKAQSLCIKILKDKKIISYVFEGLPARRYFKIDERMLVI